MSQEQKAQDTVMNLLTEFGHSTDVKVAGVTLVLAQMIEDLRDEVKKMKEEK